MKYAKQTNTGSNKNKVLVDREEYAALCALRDGVHADVVASHALLHSRYSELLVINMDQLSRLTKAMMESDHLRTAISRVEDREKALTHRISILELEAARR